MKRKWNLFEVVPAALVTAFGMQSLRVVLPLFQQYLRDTVGIPSLNLAPIALGIFALAFLPGLLVRRMGLAGALGFTMSAVAVLRILEQLSRVSSIDLFASAAAVVLFWWFLACLYSAAALTPGRAHVFPLGVLSGLALDTAVHAAAGTLDLSWQTGLLPLGAVLLLAGLILAAGPAWRAWLLPGEAASLHVPGRMVALGIWLLLQMMFFQNIARLAAVSGLSLPISALAVVSGNALAFLAIVFPGYSRGGGLITGLLITALMAFSNTGGAGGVLWQLAGQALMAVWLAAMAPAPIGIARKGRLFGGTFGPAALLFVIAAFLFYVSYDLDLGFRGQQILPVYGAVLLLAGLAGRRAPIDERLPAPAIQHAAAAAILLLLPLGLWAGWRAPAAEAPPEENRSVRVLTYNLHMGFDTDGQMAIEALAQQIEATGADVVALQEVVRGYLTTGSFDMLGWLSNRLGMPYISGPTGDAQWGNAVLSRYPIPRSEVQPLPPDLLLMRGYILAEVDIGAGEVVIIATHLHHRGADGHIREEQVPVLIEARGGAPATVILGDLNATPETPEMQLFVDAGLLNASALSPLPAYTYPSTDPDREIDYIWYAPDLLASDFRVYESTASDHLPVAVTLTLP